MPLRQRANAGDKAASPEVARVLLLEDDVTARLTLQAVQIGRASCRERV